MTRLLISLGLLLAFTLLHYRGLAFNQSSLGAGYSCGYLAGLRAGARAMTNRQLDFEPEPEGCDEYRRAAELYGFPHRGND